MKQWQYHYTTPKKEEGLEMLVKKAAMKEGRSISSFITEALKQRAKGTLELSTD